MKQIRPSLIVSLWLLFALVLIGCRQADNILPTAEPSPTAEPTPAPTPIPDISQAPGRIAFITPTGQLHTIRPDGTDERVLTSGATFYQFPAWSPTSNHIAVIGGGGREAERGVFVLADEQEGEAVPLYTATNPIYLYWSPNGQRVGFIANHPLGLALHIAPADGGQESDILSTGQPLYWQWSADNERALTHASSDGLAYVDVAGNVRPLAWGKEGRFQAPALSADGRHVAYSDGVENGRALFVYDTELEESIFQHPHRGVLAMSWSPTAAQLAYTSPTQNRTSSFGPLQLYDVATAEGHLLSGDRVLAFFWSPDGQFIAYVTVTGANSQQAKAGWQGKTAVQPTQNDEIYLTLNVVEVATGQVRTLSIFRPTLLFMGQFLPFFDQYALSHRLWSPDSQYLLLPMRGETEESEIVVIPVDGRPPLPLAPGLSAFWSYE